MNEQPAIVRTALLLNACFSVLTGLVLVALPGTVAGWMELTIDPWLRALGFALLGHAAILLTIRRTRHGDNLRRWAMLNLAVIAPYPILLVGLVITKVVERDVGVLVLLVDAVVVGAIAIIHLIGLRPVPATLHHQGA